MSVKQCNNCWGVISSTKYSFGDSSFVKVFYIFFFFVQVPVIEVGKWLIIYQAKIFSGIYAAILVES